MHNLGFLSVIIPLLIIILAIVTKDVVVSLLAGIFLGELILHNYNPFDALINLLDEFVNLFSHAWIVKTVLFALLVGSIIKLIMKAGGVDAFVSYISRHKKGLDSPKGSLFLAYIIGIFIFIESSITSLVAGTIAKPLCDKNRVSRAKLAYVCDSTSAPVCSLIPFNGWGALLLGLIGTAIAQGVIKGDSLSLLLKSIPFNFYSIITIIMVFFVILFDINIFSMKRAKVYNYVIKNDENISNRSPLIMILPILFLIIMVPLSLLYTGKGDIMKGSGSTSVFYAVIATLLFMYIFYTLKKYITHKEYFDSLYDGISDMIPIVFILLLAFLIGNIIKELGTANYIAVTLKSMNAPKELLPALIFFVAALTSFATGTSWGTFSIMMPISLGLASTFGLDIPLMIGAVVSGGIFGDHVSPISDTTIISSMASGCNHIEHVRTQMPYALIAATLAFVVYIFFGYI